MRLIEIGGKIKIILNIRKVQIIPRNCEKSQRGEKYQNNRDANKKSCHISRRTLVYAISFQMENDYSRKNSVKEKREEEYKIEHNSFIKLNLNL